MSFTDVFIKRPVLAIVVSLLIVVIGIAGAFKLDLRQLPFVKKDTITVTTSYPGANAKVVQGFVTTPIEQAIGSVDGIDYLTSTTVSGVSTITANLKLNYDSNAAMTDITGKVSSVKNVLPQGTEPSAITKATANDFPDYFISFLSDTMSNEQITSYVINVARPQLYSVGGISNVQIMGASPMKFAMRIWLDSQKMAAQKVSAEEVMQALSANNLQSTPGRLEGKYDYLAINNNTNLQSPDSFNQLIIKVVDGKPVRIKDVGQAVLGTNNYDSGATINGKEGTIVGIVSAPSANPLTVVDSVLKYLPLLQKSMPPGLHVLPVYDTTTFVRASLKDVAQTIIIAVFIVILVIFFSLGTFRGVLIPVVAIPLSLIGCCFLMSLLGFSFNLLTLLAMVLAIGLVVDDAIVVVENIFRHLEEGLSPKEAALLGAKEVSRPVIVMTLTLVAVFAPIGFVGGLTGALFIEFAYTLASTVVISGIIALTLSPMLCSKLLNQGVVENKMVKFIDHVFIKLKEHYAVLLRSALNMRLLIILMGLVLLGCCYIFYSNTPKELAPQEDAGWVGVMGFAPSTANGDYIKQFSPDFKQIFNSFTEKTAAINFIGTPKPTSVMGGMVLTPWDERKKTAMQLAGEMQAKLGSITGLNAVSWQLPPFMGVSNPGPALNFVIKSPAEPKVLYPLINELKLRALKSGLFSFIDPDLKFDNPEVTIDIDRNKAADLGIKMESINAALTTLISPANGGWFDYYGYPFKVIPQAVQKNRSSVKDMQNIYLQTFPTNSSSNSMIPLSAITSYSWSNQPSSLNRFQQLNAVTFQGNPAPGVSQGQALAYLNDIAQQINPGNMIIDYGEASRQFKQEGDAIMYAFIIALILIFLLLAAQFESFRDPIIILVSVPLSIFGALLPLFLGAGTINIYTQIAMVTLIGLISKHGILMVEFANHQQELGLSVREAIQKAAEIRLRPILMTTAAMVFGVVPLIIATGAGSVSRSNMGVVIACGMLIGTCFTLFIVPAVYTYLAKVHHK